MVAFNQSELFLKLQTAAAKIEARPLMSLFKSDSARFDNFSCAAAGLFLDYSKQLIDKSIKQDLLSLAESADLSSKIKALFVGEIVNPTEGRAALHTDLRAASKPSEVESMFAQMRDLVESVHIGRRCGFSGKRFTDVVNIGIGGSDLGPKLAYEALASQHRKLNCHYVSNLDESQIKATLENLNPETTLFIVVSKTFTTTETLSNANFAKAWLLNAAGDVDVSSHWIAVSTAIDKVQAFGVDPDNVLPMWDWVGGRYSLWSAVGVSVAMAIGMDGFHHMLEGARVMDEHFRSAEFDKNMPVILGLLAVWSINLFHCQTEAVIPYDQGLHLLPNYLQQASMESLGKSVDVDGHKVDYQTGAVLWGGVGSNSQHAFHQLLQQGTEMIPVDFIAVLKGDRSNENAGELYANCLSQSQTLAFGVSESEVLKDLQAKGMSEVDAEKLAPHKVIAGNSPSNTIVLQQLDPESLGALLALYEHKIYVESVIWNINAFDQWGVERGKVMANQIAAEMREGSKDADMDSSTKGLMNLFK